MLNEFEFGNEMQRLHTAFGVKITDQIEGKVREWFGIWQERCRNVAASVLVLMVKKAISECERMPSFAQFLILRRAVMGELPAQGWERTACSVCGGDGVIFAWKDMEGHGQTSYVFRCHTCENWRGKYDGLPMWSGNVAYNFGKIPTDDTIKPARSYVPKTIPSAGFPVKSNYEKNCERNESLRRDKEREDYDAYSELGFVK